jgi:hypothetical protein
LFSDNYLAAALDERAARMRTEIEDTPEQHVLQADEQAWAASLAERYAVRVPVLHPEDWSMGAPQEIKFNVSGWPGRDVRDPSRPFYVPGYRVVVHIPFEGSRELFLLRPSSFTTSVPYAIVQQKEVLHVVEYPHDSHQDIRAGAERLVQEINNYLGFARADVDAFNSRLDGQAIATIRARRQCLIANQARLEQTGIPIRWSEGDARRIEDVIVRRPAPVLTVEDDRRLPLEPILLDEVFEHILGLIRTVGETMEKSPKSYATLGEEDRRQQFLPMLNSHYRGQATAEAFNVAGKTDILVQFEGQNLFIAECKFWEGQQSFADAIGQLFGYTSWRDTKLALIVFVRESGMTAIVTKVRQALEQHEQFVAFKQAAGPTEFRATMRWPGDDQRFADLNVFLFHTPVTQPRKKTAPTRKAL